MTPTTDADEENVKMTREDANNLDEVVHELGIEDSFETPAGAVRKLKAEITRLRSTSQAGGVPEDVIVAAYKRGWHWNNENEGDDTFLNKAAHDYADKVLSASPPAIDGMRTALRLCLEHDDVTFGPIARSEGVLSKVTAALASAPTTDTVKENE